MTEKVDADEQDFYNIREAAEVLGYTEYYVRVFCRDGRLPAHKVGKYWRIAKEDLLEAYMKRHQDK